MSRTLLSFFAVAVFVALAVAACGDHVVVPADKTGKCVAGLLTKCGDACVDLQTDNANCGACGAPCTGAKSCVMGKCQDACPPGSTRCGDACVATDTDRANCGACGKACAANEACAKGKCAASCEAAGYLTCAGATNAFDAGGATSCVDPKTDPYNCGGCGVTCNATDTCSKGTCCGAGLVACAGQCVDPQVDPNHCGICGVKCDMTAPNCVAGACSKCNNKVLVLADNQTSVNANMQTKLQSYGFVATVVDNGGSTYTGTPAATDFGSVTVVGIASFNADMPNAGQQALVTAQQAGTGMVFDAYVSYAWSQSTRYQTIKSLGLYNCTGGVGQTGTIASNSGQAPFFVGLPTSFGTVNTNAWWTAASVINGGTQVAQFTYPGPTTIPAEYSRASPNGRIVQFTWGINWTGGAQNIWTNDANQALWYVDAVRWTAGCTN